MSESAAFKSYTLFCALQEHFTKPGYDFFKFNGKTYANKMEDRFEKRGDRFFYYKASNKYKKELQSFYISVLMSGIRVKAKDIVTDETHEAYNVWLKRNQALQQSFKTDVATIVDFMEDREISFKQVLKSTCDDLPNIVSLYQQQYISIESAVIINTLTKYTECECTANTWESAKLQLTKYRPFVKLSEPSKFAGILRNGLPNC